ncbi:hypothetical protein LMG9449_0946 [Lactococcus lactis subsp. lactis]|uniref:Uncharacterized protein n=1 Tax=Lactococcus lactis subsp. lactis TaxID=1360 RepID=A0A0V8F2G8_LACLL|nr:hypothetical protein LK231_1400 [Lactococcus lactis subsp. lactis]KSU04930.1 hypothetical protein Li1_2180 [Lactococcus lactis subsp. lactis]KSU07875.1 hypothetical protein KF282_0671 [Lactococcus lactis subsp. lactis]KSU15753.1 hypothetical protein LMG9446_0625 [Lactococcus lactis subsp. lactis]KSU18792.1 hypothetical protein LMG9449_0946 [Lactococcus lactis subsp. lactis]
MKGRPKPAIIMITYSVKLTKSRLALFLCQLFDFNSKNLTHFTK